MEANLLSESDSRPVLTEVSVQSEPLTARDALAATPWLHAVPETTLTRLADQAIVHRMPAGSVLFEQAETPTFAMLLVSGSAELLAARAMDEMLVEIVRAPDLLLPAALLSRQPYLLRARVVDAARLVMIQADAFRHAVASDHALCLAVLACQAAQFRRQVKQARNVRLRNAEERVACYLLRLIEAASPGEVVRLPLEKRHIASQLGMTRETFSRSLAILARDGLRVSGDIVMGEGADAARKKWRLDPLIDGPEAITPMTPCPPAR